jgi:hypothetical protein
MHRHQCPSHSTEKYRESISLSDRSPMRVLKKGRQRPLLYRPRTKMVKSIQCGRSLYPNTLPLAAFTENQCQLYRFLARLLVKPPFDWFPEVPKRHSSSRWLPNRPGTSHSIRGTLTFILQLNEDQLIQHPPSLDKFFEVFLLSDIVALLQMLS